MAKYLVGFDGKWQETFDDQDDAIEWAQEVAETGRLVEVVARRFGFHRFVTGFPDSEREALRARWKSSFIPWAQDNIAGAPHGSPESHHQYNSAYGGHGGGGDGGHVGHGGGH